MGPLVLSCECILSILSNFFGSHNLDQFVCLGSRGKTRPRDFGRDSRYLTLFRWPLKWLMIPQFCVQTHRADEFSRQAAAVEKLSQGAVLKQSWWWYDTYIISHFVLILYNIWSYLYTYAIRASSWEVGHTGLQVSLHTIHICIWSIPHKTRWQIYRHPCSLAK